MTGETNSSSSGGEFDFDLAELEMNNSSGDSALGPIGYSDEPVYRYPQPNGEQPDNQWAGHPNSMTNETD